MTFITACTGVQPEPTPTLTNIETAVAVAWASAMALETANAPSPTSTFTPLPPTETPIPSSTSTSTKEPTAVPTNTPIPTATLVPFQPIVPTSGNSGGGDGVCSCNSDTMNCTDFRNQSSAQACYNYCKSIGAGDIHKLDRDNDGSACEG